MLCALGRLRVLCSRASSMDLALYKEFYDREWERHEHLQSAVNTPISIVTLLAGGLVLMGKGFESGEAVLEVVFWGTGFVAAVFIGIAIYLVIRSIDGYRYERLPFPSDLAAHYSHLVEHYRRLGNPARSDEAFYQYLVRRYALAANQNMVNNVRRGEYLQRANRFLVYALCATASAGIPAGIAVRTVPVRPQDVRIINLGSDGEALEHWGRERDGHRDSAERGPRLAPR